MSGSEKAALKSLETLRPRIRSCGERYATMRRKRSLGSSVSSIVLSRYLGTYDQECMYCLVSKIEDILSGRTP